jgi:hypothetical protein
MTTFDEREHAYENMFAHDAEMMFKVHARRNSLLGHWAAEQMGLTGEAAKAYAKTVVQEDLKEAGDDDVLRKVLADLESSGVEIGEAQLRRQMNELLMVAKAQIVDEVGA